VLILIYKKKKIKIISFFNLNKKKLKKINIHYMNFLDKNLYINTILENFSRVLMNSHNTLKNKSNFKL